MALGRDLSAAQIATAVTFNQQHHHRHTLLVELVRKELKLPAGGIDAAFVRAIADRQEKESGLAPAMGA
jgi:hypothetical protein